MAEPTGNAEDTRFMRLAFALGVMFCVPGVLWLIVQARWQETEPSPATDNAQLATLNAEGSDLRVER